MEALLDPVLREYRLFPVLPILNDWPRGMVVDPEDLAVDRTVSRLVDRNQLQRPGLRGVWHFLGRLPDGLAPERGVTLHLRIAALPPDSCMVVRVGRRSFPVRGQMRHFTDFMHVPPRDAARAGELAMSYVVDVPPGWLRPTDRDVAVRLDSLSASRASLVRLCWLVTLEVAPR